MQRCDVVRGRGARRRWKATTMALDSAAAVRRGGETDEGWRCGISETGTPRRADGGESAREERGDGSERRRETAGVRGERRRRE
ncbi:hypothetical protein Scep_019596 [Stephania cephalantha]|uniref:Uncharacterized protein n=1 Tax=Stephania cephalantha TaxID=152367 RepID=A0AAP0IBB3_9MAGN